MCIPVQVAAVGAELQITLLTEPVAALLGGQCPCGGQCEAGNGKEKLQHVDQKVKDRYQ